MIDSIQSYQVQPQIDAMSTGSHQEQEPAAPEGAAGPDGRQDTVSISQQGREKMGNGSSQAPGASTDSSAELTPEEERQVEELKQRDAAVKAHEQAHMASGGGIVQGGATYEYEKGPDGRMYAVGGEVKIDSSPEQEPADTIRKMAQVRRAALAPMDPSSTDRSVAARAYQLENQARAELARENQESTQSESGGTQTAPDPTAKVSVTPAIDTGNPETQSFSIVA
jgi:hypothetical protein